MNRLEWIAALSLGFAILSTSCKAQISCGTQICEKDSAWIYRLPWVGNNQILLDHLDDATFQIEYDKSQSGGPSSANYRIPVQAVIVHFDDGSMGIEEFEVDQYIRMVNSAHLANNTGMQFYTICSPLHINSTYFSREIGGFTRPDTLYKQVDTEGAIDLFFVDTLTSVDGYGAYPFSNYLFHTVVRTGRRSPELVGGTITHELGHNFHLFHTSDCIRNRPQANGEARPCKQESVSRTRGQGFPCDYVGHLKCEINGDALCDTPADPYLKVGDNVQVTPNGCVFTASMSGDIRDKDRWGDTWTPDVTNIMGLADDCRATFSPMQIAVMQLTATSYIPGFWQRVENDFDVFEPNNYPESASDIALNEVQHHTFHWSPVARNQYQACDEDWIRFETTSFGAVSIRTEEVLYWLWPRTELELFDANMNLISSTNFYYGVFGWITGINLAAGQYWVRVTNTASLPSPESRGHYNIQILPGPPVGTEDRENIAHLISVAPNPSQGELFVQYSDTGPLRLEIKLTDLQGRTHLQDLVSFSGKSEHRVDATQLPDGIYFLSLGWKGGSMSRKIALHR